MPRKLFGVLFLLSLIWGGSFFFIKILLHDFGPWTIAFLRSSFGLITIVMMMFILRKPFKFRGIAWIPMVIMALLNTAVSWAFIGLGETRLTSSMASVLNAITPLWTMILGILFFHAVTKRLQWLGMGIAFIGLIVLLGVNPISIMSVDLLGFAWMMTATLSYALGSQLSKRLLKGLSMYQITFCTLLCGMLGSGIVAFATEPIPFSHIVVPANIGALIGVGVFGSGVAFILFFYIVQKGSPEFATMVTYLVPVTAIIWGYTLLDEQIEWSLLTGLAFILGGVYMASKSPSEKMVVKKPQASSHYN